MPALLKHGASRANENLDELRRATAAVARAIGRAEEVEVEFVTENPGAAGNTVRIERPDPSLPYQQVVRARGQADSVALKLRHHDAALHARHVPRSAQARQVFNALEQTRCEVLGARTMAGVAINLDAALDARLASLDLERLGDSEQAPLPEMLGLLAREAMLGQLPPPSAAKVLGHWRPKLESMVGTDLVELSRCVGDQRAYAQAMRELLRSLGFTDEQADPQYDDSDDENAESEGDESALNEGEAGEADASLSESMEGAEMRDGAGEDEADAGDMESLDPGSLEFGEEDSETPGEAVWRPQPGHNVPDREQYHAYCTDYDEIIEAAELCEQDEAEPPAHPPRPAALAPAERHRQAREPAPAPAAGEAGSVLGIRPRRRLPRHRPARAGGRESHPRTLLQDGEGDGVPRHRGQPAHRQLGLDARSSHRGRGDERGHPRPHPGAVWSEGRDPGLHHPRLERRAVPRAMARGGQAPERGSA